MTARDSESTRLRAISWRRLAGLVALVALVAGTAQAQGTMYANATVAVLDDAGGTQQATLMPGTAVTVLGTAGASTQVQVSGWSVEGAASVVFEGVGRRVVLAVLAADAKVDRKVVDSKKDDYGSTWQQVTVGGWVASDALVESLDAVWQGGRKLYESRCSACHSLHATTEFSANQWPGILKSMGKKAALDQDQLDLVTRFLQAHGKGQ